MSGAPKNIQRDGIYIDLDATADRSMSADVAATSANPKINTDGTVYVDTAQVASDANATTSIAANSIKGVGILINAPRGDRTAYRVKATAGALLTATASQPLMALVIGYAPASPASGDSALDEPRFIHFDRDIDDLVIIDAEASGDTYEDRALGIGVVVAGGSGGFGDYIQVSLSVQNLGVKPPTMQFAVP